MLNIFGYILLSMVGFFGGYFISVMAALPYADCYCQEYHQGMWRYLIARSTTSKYVVGKIGRVFLSGGSGTSRDNAHKKINTKTLLAKLYQKICVIRNSRKEARKHEDFSIKIS